MSPTMLDRDLGVPLWIQLRDDLLRRLAAGHFSDRFPGELELVEQYGVSRHTVREALRQLRDDGVIQSSRGRSSVAHPDVINQQLGAMYSLFHALESQGIVQRSDLLVRERRMLPAAAAELGLAPDTELVHLERLRYADDVPLALDRAWLAPDIAEPLLEADFRRTGLYDEWQRLAGIRLTGGREVIRAAMPTPDQRSLLAVRGDEAVLEITRVGHLGERPVEYRVTVVRGSRFSLSAEWSSGSAYQVGVTG